MTTHQGHCHCGAVRFEMDSAVDSALQCNCSFCIRRGTTIHRVPADNFRLLAGEDQLNCYGSREFSEHYFCRTCGIQCLSRVNFGDEPVVMVNLGCFDPDLLAGIEPSLFDGASKL
ncbi:MAG TPA: GFA family protein [Porticoccaceae bacterium]|nr:GFA family protein [Porticoccaceae bacterium]